MAANWEVSKLSAAMSEDGRCTIEARLGLDWHNVHVFEDSERTKPIRLMSLEAMNDGRAVKTRLLKKGKAGRGQGFCFYLNAGHTRHRTRLELVLQPPDTPPPSLHELAQAMNRRPMQSDRRSRPGGSSVYSEDSYGSYGSGASSSFPPGARPIYLEIWEDRRRVNAQCQTMPEPDAGCCIA